MPTLTALTLYPIKSCAGISVSSAILHSTGLSVDGIGDREWMLVDRQGNFLTQRELPAMATLQPRLNAQGFEVNAPEMPALQVSVAPVIFMADAALDVRIWNDQLRAIDCGDEAANWFSAALSSACRLVRFDRHARRLADPVWSDGVEAPTMFADGFPVLLISEATLEDLNQRLRTHARPVLPMERFRPNVVIGGTAAFEEDYAATLSIGQAILKPTKPCPRCAIPSIDQQTGISGLNPLDILQGYRSMAKIGGGIAFGMNAIVAAGAGASLRVGQEVEIELCF